jgi:glucokinase
VLFSPHLAWRHEPLRDAVYRRIGLSVVVENDANAAAWAEFRFGAAQREDDLVCITLGTGIGGAVMIGGLLFRGRHGMAGEFGHMQVVPDGQVCECGGTGCWEQYSSGNALVRYSRARVGVEPTLLTALCSGNPDLLVGAMVTAAAEQGDPVACEAFDTVGDWLGVGLANLVAAFDPEVVVVGGGVSAAGDRLLDPARIALTRSLVGVGHRVVPELRRAQLGPEAGVVGAADLARQAQVRR